MKTRTFILGVAGLSLSGTALAQNDSFANAMDAAMARMHNAMMTGYTGQPDRDFAQMMIPHHQGAIDAAQIELRFGKDERLRRLAQGIIVEQRQEIMVMQDILRIQASQSHQADPVTDDHSQTNGEHQ